MLKNFRLTSPLLLIAVAISIMVGYKLSKRQIEKKLVIFGHELTLAQQYGVVAICSIPLFIWAGAGAAVFWVIGKFKIVKMPVISFIMIIKFLRNKNCF